VGERLSKQTGHPQIHGPQWDAPMRAEGAGRSPPSLKGPGEVPEDWRKANITAVFKKGKKEDPRKLQASQPHLHP